MTSLKSPNSLSEFPRKPPEAWAPLVQLAAWTRSPVDRFLQTEASSGILLLASAAVALFLANSPWSSWFFALWHAPIGMKLGNFEFERSVEWVINDGLMVVFFFVVGLEIRREVHEGELSDFRRAVLPAAAAIGGMLAPALVYAGLAGSGGASRGWGVPMATDIAFAVGVLALLGRRVPPALRVLLLALAVIDDLGAILIIAIFYSKELHPEGLAIAGAGLGAIFLLQKFGVRSKVIYFFPAFVTWAGIYATGVHPTLAGVVVGLCTPVRPWLGVEARDVVARDLIESPAENAQEVNATLQKVQFAQRETLSPVDSLLQLLHPWVAFGIMPLFALANAGVPLGSGELDATSSRAAWGAGVGLVLGKPLGVAIACAVVLRLGVAKLPRGLGARHVLLLGLVAGIGFTMSLFVAQLAFADRDLLDAAKLGVLAGSAIAGVLAVFTGFRLLPGSADDGARTAHEAERSTAL